MTGDGGADWRSDSICRPTAGNSTGKNNINSSWAEEALKPSDAKYRLLFENAIEAIVVLQDGMIRFFNPQFIRISGYQEDEFIFRPFLEFIYPDDKEMVIKNHQRRLRGEVLPQSYICRAIHKNGQVIV